jgi:Na+-translocating ferredoxin:NAD+ oxidoreductase RnfC subunit
MRSLGFSMMSSDFWSKWGDLCCGCGLCTLYACPEELYPKEACDQAKARMREMGLRWRGTSLEVRPHPMLEARRVPLRKLEEHLNLVPYDRPAPLVEREWAPRQVRLLRRQHVGAPTVPLVEEGETVREGQKIADVPPDQLGVPLHASIAGRVRRITETEIILEG